MNPVFRPPPGSARFALSAMWEKPHAASGAALSFRPPLQASGAVPWKAKGPGMARSSAPPWPFTGGAATRATQEVESACKPGSVRLATRQSFLSARRRRLAPATYPGTTRAALSFPYSVLLRVGFTVPCGVGPARGALLPHPFTLTCALAGHRRSALCCTGRQLALPRRYLAPCPMEPGLSSTHSSCDATVRPTPGTIVVARKPGMGHRDGKHTIR
jgi:hypothetical protein